MRKAQSAGTLLKSRPLAATGSTIRQVDTLARTGTSVRLHETQEEY